MNQRTRLTLYMLAGLYLTYTGGKLCIEIIKGQPENFIIYTLFGVLFLGGGIVLFAKSLKEYIMGDYFFQNGKEEDEEEKTPDVDAYEQAAIETDVVETEKADNKDEENS